MNCAHCGAAEDEAFGDPHPYAMHCLVCGHLRSNAEDHLDKWCEAKTSASKLLRPHIDFLVARYGPRLVTSMLCDETALLSLAAKCPDRAAFQHFAGLSYDYAVKAAAAAPQSSQTQEPK